MERLSWREAQQYWKDARARTAALDESTDPDALGNVCHVGAPAWFNDYYARHQRAVFEALLAECSVSSGARALDVGCGAGRWCRLLAASGYQVEGIDLQQPLIERNRERYPGMKFHCVAVQDFAPSAPFDLVTTVTVIQHLPFEEQALALTRIASMIKPGGHLLSLENIADQGAHVFANSIDEWTRAFERVGLSRVSIRRYDYSPAIRMSSALVNATASVARRIGIMSAPEGAAVPRAPTAQGSSEGGRVRQAVRSAGWASRRAALFIDDRLEPLLIRMNAKLPTVHCGFLFRRSV